MSIAAAAWNWVREHWRSLRRHPHVRLLAKIVQYVLFAGIVGYLLYELTKVGWVEVLQNLPTSSWFYALFFLRFFVLPVSEVAAYSLVWRRPLLGHFPALVRKQVYNSALIGYSGEVYFALWARRRLGLPDKQVLAGVKDNNILSAFTSNLATVVMVLGLAFTGGLQAGLAASPGATVFFAMGFVSAFALSIAVTLFRRKILTAADPLAGGLMAIHSARLMLGIVMHAAMYKAALPGTALGAWFLFIALDLVLNRIPFLPNRNLVFAAVALPLASIIGAPPGAVAGMLATELALFLMLNFALLFATAKDIKRPRGAPAL